MTIHVSLTSPATLPAKLENATPGTIVKMVIEFEVQHQSSDLQSGGHLSGEALDLDVSGIRWAGGHDSRMEQAAERGMSTSTHGVTR